MKSEYIDYISIQKHSDLIIDPKTKRFSNRRSIESDATKYRHNVNAFRISQNSKRKHLRGKLTILVCIENKGSWAHYRSIDTWMRNKQIIWMLKESESNMLEYCYVWPYWLLTYDYVITNLKTTNLSIYSVGLNG